ncbi:MAG: hypothetical protein NT144_13780 [Bacteroidia bacterium]|nr:hypothetical protein [Bacteroidia bacterium]
MGFPGLKQKEADAALPTSGDIMAGVGGAMPPEGEAPEADEATVITEVKDLLQQAMDKLDGLSVAETKEPAPAEPPPPGVSGSRPPLTFKGGGF